MLHYVPKFFEKYAGNENRETRKHFARTVYWKHPSKENSFLSACTLSQIRALFTLNFGVHPYPVMSRSIQIAIRLPKVTC